MSPTCDWSVVPLTVSILSSFPLPSLFSFSPLLPLVHLLVKYLQSYLSSSIPTLYAGHNTYKKTRQQLGHCCADWCVLTHTAFSLLVVSYIVYNYIIYRSSGTKSILFLKQHLPRRVSCLRLVVPVLPVMHQWQWSTACGGSECFIVTGHMGGVEQRMFLLLIFTWLSFLKHMYYTK